MKRTLEYVAGLLLLFMFLTTFFQVLARAVFHISAVWSEELARLTYVWMVFLGAAVLIREDKLIRVTALSDRIGARAGRALRFVTDLAIVPLLAVLTWGAWTNTRLNWNTVAPTVDWLRMGYVYLVIAAAGVMMLWYQGRNLLDQLRAPARSPAGGPVDGPEGWQ